MRGTNRLHPLNADTFRFQLLIAYFTGYNVLHSLVYCNTHGLISQSKHTKMKLQM
jgi:hypothetical protein